MTNRSWLLLSAFLFSVLCVAIGYHDQFSNQIFHCWLNDDAHKDNMFQCDHVNFVWMEEPPVEVIQGRSFNVSYKLKFENDDPTKFFQWMIDSKYLPQYTNPQDAIEFCKQDCGDPNDASLDNCCIWHYNVHSCPLDAITEADDICGPWIQPSGNVFTHTASLASRMQEWETEVVLNSAGQSNYIIAHIKIGTIQMALGKKMHVHPKADCGDGYCDPMTETCESCKMDCCPGLKLTILILIIVISSLLVLALLVIPLVWYLQKQRFLYDETWIIDWDEIKPSTGYKGFGSVKSIGSTMLSQTSLGQNGDVNVQTLRGQIFCDTGIYEGKLVSVKKIQKAQFQLSRAARVEIRNVRALDHMNLAKFGGIVTEINNFSIITEYCNKGSLNDVLLNDEIPLNWGFRLSFAQDICRGMEYLHNHKMYHGRLKSSNCIIDDRWVCKLTDFGLPNIRKADMDPEFGEQFGSVREKRINRVYRPPEANADESMIYQPTTDVYSFSIILIEIGGRTEISPPEERIYDPHWRPALPDLEDHDKDPDNRLPLANKYIELITLCWGDVPADRPNFTHVKKILHSINPNKENPVDMMMKLMEKYSKHLESLVSERTQELVEEKKKTDRLLYAMLPKKVAEDLKQGNPVLCSKYDCCTIFFSDIVGFTHLSSSSTPLEVVELLNQMYTAFDSIIDEHDVYKVETIGDAYMVVSGLPEKNGDQHAAEIATMALKIVCFCRGFRVPHRPNQIVNIRAGIHSGPVVTGVVGLKMPRYCLFGDTVNMASRMESTGEALKIQVSPDTHEILLQQKDEFKFEYRGEIEIKGKGTKQTHWLLGRQDLLIQNCLSPVSHKRIFRGTSVPPPTPLTPPEQPRLKALSPILSPSSSPKNNGLSTASISPPSYNNIATYDNEISPLIRGNPERESTTSRDHLLGPDL